jgi:pentatricopeptide repeat protein
MFMAKNQRGRKAPAQPAALDPHGRAVRHFHAGRLDDAIAIWEPLQAKDPGARAALAETHFRRALKLPRSDDRAVSDLQAAIKYAPTEARYRYHLALALHVRGETDAARAAYEQVIAANGPQGATLLLGLVLLEDRPRTDLRQIPQLSEVDHAILAPFQALLRGQPLDAAALEPLAETLRKRYDAGSTKALITFWEGLSRIQRGDATAAQPLSDEQNLPTAKLNALRRFYRGVAAALADDTAGAFAHWRKISEQDQGIANLAQNLTVSFYEQISDRHAAGDLDAAATLVMQSITFPLLGTAVLDELRVQVLDQAAQQAARSGNWQRAAEYWETARAIITQNTSIGSTRPIWHNLALAYEAQEEWVPAAESWRGMLRTRPRKGAKTADPLSDAQWAWVRTRVIECYRQAGRPDEAVTVFRQMIKAEPNDLALRLQLVDALLANEQEQAAVNEIGRILTIDPTFVDARLRRALLHHQRYRTPPANSELRKLAQEHPERDDVRRAYAYYLRDFAKDYLSGSKQQNQYALQLFEEGHTLIPTDPQFPLGMGKALLNLDQKAKGRDCLNKVLDLAGDQLPFYSEVFLCWLIEEDIDEARAVIERAKTHKPVVDFYLTWAIMVFEELNPQPPAFGGFGGLGLLSAFGGLQPPTPPKPMNPKWKAFGIELIDQAIALEPNDARISGSLILVLVSVDDALALEHAQRAAKLAPDQPEAQLILAMVFGINGQKAQAKEQFRKTAQLARKQNRNDLARDADDMRRSVDSPEFVPMMRMHMQSMRGMSDLDPDELADMLDDFGDPY